jgi:micrococcal nuclease
VSAAKIPSPYVYRAEVTSVYDGDTITVMLDLGMGINRKAKCRLLGVDTPEIRTKSAAEKKAGYTARDRVRELILGKTVLLHSVAKPDKYGRLLVKVWAHDGSCVNQLLIDEGLAREYDGGTKVPYASWT